MEESEVSLAKPSAAEQLRKRWKGVLFIVIFAILMKLLLMYLHGQISYQESMYKWAITSCHAHQGTWVDAPPPARFQGTCH